MSTKIPVIRLALLDELKEIQKSAKDQLVTKIENMLKLLIPKDDYSDLHEDIYDFVDKAIKLANEMSEERTMFQCFMADQGKKPDEAIIETLDQTGLVWMCTFPGLAVQREKRVILVKASAELSDRA